MSLDQNVKQIGRVLLPTIENLVAIKDYLATIPSAPTDALEEEPFNYTADEAYALRLWAQHAAVYATIFSAGGSLSAGDATTLAQLTRRLTGSTVLVNQGV
jgi:hypothetical protein